MIAKIFSLRRQFLLITYTANDGQLCRNVCRVGSREARILTSTSATNASPTSSASLSTTSSSEAQEALKHVDRLDRNRVSTSLTNVF